VSARAWDSTIARIAGNLLSGFPFDEYSPQDQERFVVEAVQMARAIVKEVESATTSASVDPHAASTGTPSTRAFSSFRSPTETEKP